MYVLFKKKNYMKITILIYFKSNNTKVNRFLLCMMGIVIHKKLSNLIDVIHSRYTNINVNVNNYFNLITLCT